MRSMWKEWNGASDADFPYVEELEFSMFISDSTLHQSYEIGDKHVKSQALLINWEISGAGDSRVNPRFHPTPVGWNLGSIREFPTPGNRCMESIDVTIVDDIILNTAVLITGTYIITKISRQALMMAAQCHTGFASKLISKTTSQSCTLSSPGTVILVEMCVLSETEPHLFHCMQSNLS